MTGYEVQGRKTERGNGGRVVRNHVRLASAENQAAAFEAAIAMVADEYTAWVFRTEQSAGRKSYILLGVLPEKPAG